MTRLLAILVGGLCATASLGASPDPKDLVIPPEDLSKARELVRKLGSESFRDREEAHSELLKMGRKARPALLEAVGSDPDPEVRFRCSRLLPKAGADDLKARLDTFLADAEGKYNHDLPGLKAFRKSVGLDEKSRALFVEIIKSPYNVDLFQAIDRSPAEGGRAIADRRAMLYSRMQHRQVNGRIIQPEPIALPEIASLLFAESLVSSKDIPRTGMWAYVTGVTFLYQPASQQAMMAGSTTPHSAAFRRILGAWMESRDDLQDLNQVYSFAGNQLKDLPQSLPLLRRTVTTEGVQGYAKGQSLTFLVQANQKAEIPFLKKLLTDDTLVQQVWLNNGIGPRGQPGQPHSCLLRDVALAFLITLTGQEMKDYGYSFPQGFSQNLQQLGFANYAFSTDEARAAAMVKFGFWQLKQQFRDPDAKPPEPKKNKEPQPSRPIPRPGLIKPAPGGR
jgi:hypothetical protein